MNVHNYSNRIFCIWNRACEDKNNFQTAFLVKGPGNLCNLETKVTECLESLVVCGYGETVFKSQLFYKTQHM